MRLKNIHRRDDRMLMEAVLLDSGPVRQVNYIAVSMQGQNCPLHHHDDLTETFICLEGILRLTVDGQPHDLLPNDECQVAPGQQHALLASPGARYLELRSSIFDLAAPDKHMAGVA